MFFVVFVVLPLLEIAALVFVAGQIGWLWTLYLALLCSVVGFWQLKIQGIGAWRRLRDDLRHDKRPAAAILDGALRVLAAALLTVPGLVTAAFSLPLFIGPIRRQIGRFVAAATIGRLKSSFLIVSTGPQQGETSGRDRASGVVDVEGWEEPTTQTGPHPGQIPPGERD